jgi:predicted transcriptional regulator
MYKANLSFVNLNAYLNLLIRADLVEKKDADAALKKGVDVGRRCDAVYELTPKGTAVLQKLKSLEEIMTMLELKRQRVVLVQ